MKVAVRKTMSRQPDLNRRPADYEKAGLHPNAAFQKDFSGIPETHSDVYATTAPRPKLSALSVTPRLLSLLDLWHAAPVGPVTTFSIFNAIRAEARLALEAS